MNGGGNKIGIAYAEIVLNKDRFLADVRGAEAGFRQGAAAITQSANSVTNAIKNVVVAIGGLYAIQRVIRSAVDAFADFDRELRNVWTLTNATWSEMQKLGAEIRELAPQYGKTAAEATRALYDIYSAGFQGAEAMSILKASATGAAAGLTDIRTAAAVTIATLNAYQMGANKAAYVTDVLFKTVEKGVITYEELASTFGRLIGLAAPLGVSLEEVAAAIAVLTKQGISADEAVTAVRAAIMSLASPTQVTEKLIKDLGYSSGEAMVRQLGFAESLRRVVEAGQAAGLEMTEMFTNIRAVLAVLPLATTAAQTYADTQRDLANAAGAAQAALGKQAPGLAFQLSKLKAGFDELSIALGEVLLPFLRTLLDLVRTLVGPLRRLIALLTIPIELGVKVTGAERLKQEFASGLKATLMAAGLGWLTGSLLARFGVIAAPSVPTVVAVAVTLQLLFAIETYFAKPPQTILGEISAAIVRGLGGGAIGAAIVAALKKTALGVGITAGVAGGVVVSTAAVLMIIPVMIRLAFAVVTARDTQREMERIRNEIIDQLSEAGPVWAETLAGVRFIPSIDLGTLASLAGWMAEMMAALRSGWMTLDEVAAGAAETFKKVASDLRIDLLDLVVQFAGAFVEIPEEFANVWFKAMGLSLDQFRARLLEMATMTTTVPSPVELSPLQAALLAIGARLRELSDIAETIATDTIEYVRAMWKEAPEEAAERIRRWAAFAGQFEQAVEWTRAFIAQIQWTIDAMAFLGYDTAALREQLEAFERALSRTVPVVDEVVEDWTRQLHDLIGGLSERLLPTEWNRVVQSARSLWTALTTIGTQAVGLVGQVLAGVDVVLALQNAFGVLHQQIVKQVQSAFDAVTDAAYSLWERVSNLAASFAALIRSTDEVTRLQKAMAVVQRGILSMLLGFLWPVIAILETITGLFGEIREVADTTSAAVMATRRMLSDLNVPIGWKAERIRYAAARPGEPPIMVSEPEPTPREKRPTLPSWLQDIVDKFGTAIEAALVPLREAIDTIRRAWAILADIIMPELIEWLRGIGVVLSSVAANIVDFLVPILARELPAILKSLGAGFNALLEGGLRIFTAFIGYVLIPVIATFADALRDVGQWVRNVLAPDVESLFAKIGEWWRTEMDPFLRTQVFPKIAEWGMILYSWIKDKLLPFLENAVWPFLRDKFWPVFEKLATAFLTTLGRMWETIEKHWPAIEEWIIKKLAFFFQRLTGQLEMGLVAILYETSGFWAAMGVLWNSQSISLWDKVKYTFLLGVDALVRLLGATIGFVVGGFNRLLEVIVALGGLGQAVIRAIAGLPAAIVEMGLALLQLPIQIINLISWGIQETFKWIINRIIALINWALGWAGVNIPYLQHGGIIHKPTVAMVGEAGPEAVIPLAKMEHLFGSGELTVHNVIVLDGRVIYEDIKRRERSENIRSGWSLERVPG